MPAPRLVVADLNKAYAAPVLVDVSLELGPGEIRAIVGENGAGKSTLVSIVTGLVRRDGGRLFLDGETYAPSGPADAIAAGVSFAAQELSIVPSLSIAENIFLRNLPARAMILARNDLHRRARGLLQRVGLSEVSPDTKAAELRLAQRQLVEMAKALAIDCRLLILDEPTAALTAPQAEILHAVIANLAANGVSILYISHRLDDVLSVADTVSVLRDGRVVATDTSDALDVPALVRHMTGSSSQYHSDSTPRQAGLTTAIEIDGLCTRELPAPVSFSASAGEIVGVFGLAGSGRSELLQAVFGLTPTTGGHVGRLTNDGRRIVADAGDALRLGMAFLGEDRQTDGVFPGHSVLYNMMVPGAPNSNRPLARIDGDAERAAARSLAGKLDIRCRGLGQNISELSGGNQQKALLARWLHRKADVFLLDEPTRGVDVGTRHVIYALLDELRQAGACILMASSELEELTGICDRILVLSGRRPVRIFERGEWSDTTILAAAFEAHTARLDGGRHRPSHAQ